MAESDKAGSDEVSLRLNQQQLELVDRTLSWVDASDRASLMRLALREFHKDQRG